MREDERRQPSVKDHNDDAATTDVGDTDRSGRDACRTHDDKRSHDGMQYRLEQANGHMEDREANAVVKVTTACEAIGGRRNKTSLEKENTDARRTCSQEPRT